MDETWGYTSFMESVKFTVVRSHCLSVTTEGVENETQFRFLHDLQCNEIQWGAEL